MPRLLLFAPCDNVLLSGETQSASLIIVLSQIVFQAALPDPLPPNAAAPMRWCTFSQWEMGESEVGIEHAQKVSLIGPDGSEKIANTVTFIGEQDKPVHRVVVTNFGFPIVAAGIYRLKLSYQRTGEESWVDAADYPLQISYAPAVVPTPVQ